MDSFIVPHLLSTSWPLSPPTGQPAATAEGAGALCTAGQAEPGSVSRPTWATPAGHKHHVTCRLVWTLDGCQRERQEKNAWQVSELWMNIIINQSCSFVGIQGVTLYFHLPKKRFHFLWDIIQIIFFSVIYKYRNEYISICIYIMFSFSKFTRLSQVILTV